MKTDSKPPMTVQQVANRLYELIAKYNCADAKVYIHYGTYDAQIPVGSVDISVADDTAPLVVVAEGTDAEF